MALSFLGVIIVITYVLNQAPIVLDGFSKSSNQDDEYQMTPGSREEFKAPKTPSQINGFIEDEAIRVSIYAVIESC